MQIIIIGAGLGGLTAALCLARAGHAVTVLERQAHLSKTGGIISLRPSGVQLLRSQGLAAALEGQGKFMGESHYRTLHDGKSIRKVDLREQEMRGEGMAFTTLRPHLARILLDAALAAGVVVRYNATVTALEEDAKVARVSISTAADKEVSSPNTESLQADLVLVADGIRSRLRQSILSDFDPSQLEPVVTDATMYVADIPTAKLSPSTRNAFADPSESADQLGKMTFWAGKDIWGVSIPNETSSAVYLGATIVEPTTQTSLWDEAGDGDYVRRVFGENACAEMCDALRYGEKFDRWRLAYMPSLPRWTSTGAGKETGNGEAMGRIALLGDSAHAVLPNAGAGISITMEDVWALVELLSKHGSNGEANAEDVPRLLQIWERICKPRADRVREYSLFNARSMKGDPEARAETEKALKAEAIEKQTAGYQPRMDMYAQWSTLAFARWMSGYSPPEAVESYMKSLGQRN